MSNSPASLPKRHTFCKAGSVLRALGTDGSIVFDTELRVGDLIFVDGLKRVVSFAPSTDQTYTYRLSGLETRTQALSLVGLPVFVPRTNASKTEHSSDPHTQPSPAKNRVLDCHNNLIGFVESTEHFGASPLIVIRSPDQGRMLRIVDSSDWIQSKNPDIILRLDQETLEDYWFEI